ncbi:MAG: D-alanyl-D-alanine carboxypeptidase family protein [Deltaproteobacteria bacterium]|nr:D-alanyl-D-alanine carboxypeptidase family protein [Deltaproteobacteria bacterium]
MRARFERELRDLGLATETGPRQLPSFPKSAAAEYESPQPRDFVPVEELERKHPMTGGSEEFSKFRSLVYEAQTMMTWGGGKFTEWRREWCKKKCEKERNKERCQERCEKRKGTFVDNLPKTETVENVKIHPSAAKPLQDLLDAARLEISRQGKQIKVKAGNAYRSTDWQLETWGTARFPQYYGEAVKMRLIGRNDFSKPAAEKLAAYIRGKFAAPGFSNHQHGLAVDFHTTESFDGKPQPLTASFKQLDLWQKSWLWNWLERGKNAYKFGFVPYKVEPWHWEYRPQKAKVLLGGSSGTGGEAETKQYEVEQSQPASSAGPLRIRYTSSVIPRYKDKHDKLRATDCSIFVPSALRGLGEIDLLIFFHGLDTCSPRHEFDPDKVIKNFQIAEQIDKAERKVALVVPAVHWKSIKKGEKKNTAGVWSASRVNSFVEESLDQIGKHGTRPSLGRLIIAGHSRAYEVMTPLANEFERGAAETRKGALARLAEVWALDTTFGSGHAEAIGRWAGAVKNAQFSVVLHKKETIRIKDRTSFTPLWHWNRSSVAKTKLKNVLLVKADEPHCEIPKKHIEILLSAVK